MQTSRSLFHDSVSNLRRASIQISKCINKDMKETLRLSCCAQTHTRDLERTVTREGTVLKHALRKRQHCGLMFSLRCRAADCRAADCLARTHLPDPIGLVLLKSSPRGEEYSVVISSTISGLPRPHTALLPSINSTSSNTLSCFRQWGEKKSALVTATSGPQTQMHPVSPAVTVSQATAEEHIGGA